MGMDGALAPDLDVARVGPLDAGAVRGPEAPRVAPPAGASLEAPVQRFHARADAGATCVGARRMRAGVVGARPERRAPGVLRDLASRSAVVAPEPTSAKGSAVRRARASHTNAG